MGITLNEIAKMCGVSRGTVDRVLHDRPNVRPEIAERIKQVANEYGYVPNRAGLALSRRSKPFKLGIIVHSANTPFMRLVLDAARREAARLSSFSIEVIFRLALDIDPVEQAAMIDELVELDISGLAISPANNMIVENKINELMDKDIPVITFNTDLPRSKRMCYVGQSNLDAGKTAASLMTLSTKGRGTVSVLISPYENHAAYTDRLRGFQQEIASLAPDIRFLRTDMASDDYETAKASTLKLLESEPDLSGIYSVTPAYSGICEALVESSRYKDINLIVHDEIEQNLQYTDEGVVDFVIGQDYELQGTLPLTLLSDYIQLKQPPKKEYYHTDIRILLKQNIIDML